MSKSVMLGSERELEAGKKDVVRYTFLRRQKMWRGPTRRPKRSGQERTRADKSGQERAGAGKSGGGPLEESKKQELY